MKRSSKDAGLDVHQATPVSMVREESGPVLVRSVVPTASALPGLREQTGVSIQDDAICNRHTSDIEDNLAVNGKSEAIGGEMVWALLRHDDEVSVSNAVAVHEVPDTLEREGGPHPPSDSLRHGHDARGDMIGAASEIVNLCIRNDEAFTGRSRLQGHKGRDKLVAIYEAGGCAFRNDLAEDAGHGITRESSWLPTRPS